MKNLFITIKKSDTKTETHKVKPKKHQKKILKKDEKDEKKEIIFSQLLYAETKVENNKISLNSLILNKKTDIKNNGFKDDILRNNVTKNDVVKSNIIKIIRNNEIDLFHKQDKTNNKQLKLENSLKNGSRIPKIPKFKNKSPKALNEDLNKNLNLENIRPDNNIFELLSKLDLNSLKEEFKKGSKNQEGNIKKNKIQCLKPKQNEIKPKILDNKDNLESDKNIEKFFLKTKNIKKNIKKGQLTLIKKNVNISENLDLLKNKNSFIQNLQQTINKSTNTENKSSYKTMQTIKTQLQDSITYMSQNNRKQVVLKLNPEHLGKLEINISMMKKNTKVEIKIQKHETLQLLTENQTSLKNLFSTIKKTGNEISFSFDKNTNSNSNQEQKHKNKNKKYQIQEKSFNYLENETMSTYVGLIEIVV